MPFVYLQPGEELVHTEHLSGIEYAVLISSARVHVYIDAHARVDRNDVRQIHRGDWIALMQHEDLPAEEDPQSQTWDFGMVMHVRQHINYSGVLDNNIASLTVHWLRGYNVPVCNHTGVNVENCRHYVTQNFQVMTSEHDTHWCLFEPLIFAGGHQYSYHVDRYDQLLEEFDGDVDGMCAHLDHAWYGDM